MNLKTLCLAAAAAICLGGCSGMNSTVDGKTFVYTDGQSCPAIMEMDRGQIIEVILDENPSTGYVWLLADHPKLFKAEEIYQAGVSKSKTPVVGAGGQKTFRFTAKQAGEEVLHLKHARAWENTSIDEWKCRVRIS